MDVVVVAGKTVTDLLDYGDEEEPGFYELVEPLCVEPPPTMLAVPEDTPLTVKDELDNAFSLYWHDASACGNRLRAALERLMDHYGVLVGVGAKLHARIEDFGKANAVQKDRLLAVKWLGNEASHESLSASDVLDAMEILEVVLEDLFGSREAERKRIDDRAKAIALHRGPVAAIPACPPMVVPTALPPVVSGPPEDPQESDSANQDCGA